MRLILLLAIFQLSLFAQNDCRQQRHDVVFIHGIASSNGAFGHWEEYLQKFHPDECIKGHFFEYDTGNNKLDINDFIKSFDKFMHEKLSYVGQRKVSIVAHSQGGLITLFWLNQMRLTRDPLAYEVQNIMTMATPYYGARIANLGYGLGTYILPILGRKELRAMKIGSPLVIQTNELLASEEFSSFIRQKNFVTISAVLSPTWLYHDIEGDIAVAPASSNPNTNKAHDVSKHYNIFGVHLRFNLFGTPATTRVSKKCLDGPRECDNSSLAIFEKEFLGNQKVNIEEVQNLNTFFVYLKTSANGPIYVSEEGIRRGINFKFSHIRDDIYFYKGRLDEGLEQAQLKIYIGNEEKLITVKAAQTVFIR